MRGLYVQIRLDEGLKKRLVEAAARERRTSTSLAAWLIDRGLDELAIADEARRRR